jgi:DNA-binding LacI/PurR family transcriptional regulator
LSFLFIARGALISPFNFLTMNQPATITDVAKKAGVALGTVSRVLNNIPGVNDSIRERVAEAARALNYSRLRRRKAPVAEGGARGGRPRNVGVVCFGMEDSLVQLPVVSAALQSIEGVVAGMGGSLLLSISPRGDRVPAFLASGRVAGLILKGPNQGELPSPADNRFLQQLYRLPYVWLMGRLPGAPGDHCNFDTEEAGRIAAAHLFEKGHRHVAFLNPKPGQTQFERVKHSFIEHARRLGCEAELFESPPPGRRVWPLPAITSPENVGGLAARWLACPAKKRATAFFVPADRTSLQLYSALEARGARPGRDVGIISCNNEQSIIAGMNPALTTIDVRAAAIGERAAHQLFWRIAHPEDPASAQIMIQPVLVERDSVPARRD